MRGCFLALQLQKFSLSSQTFQLAVALGTLPGVACERSSGEVPRRKSLLGQGMKDEWVGEAGVQVSDRVSGATSMTAESQR